MSWTTKKLKLSNIRSRYTEFIHLSGKERNVFVSGILNFFFNIFVPIFRCYPSSVGKVLKAMSCPLSFGNRWSMRCLLNAERRCPDARYIYYGVWPSKPQWSLLYILPVFDFLSVILAKYPTNCWMDCNELLLDIHLKLVNYF